MLWPQGRKVRAIQLHLGEEGIGKMKITNIFPTFEISLWSLLLASQKRAMRLVEVRQGVYPFSFQWAIAAFSAATDHAELALAGLK